jgi:Cytochrome c7 and related cytochrome c
MRSIITDLSLVVMASVAVSSFFLNRASLAGSVRKRIAGTPQVFTPAHPTVLDSAREFLGWRDNAVQPLAFTHKRHVENQITCTACHEGVQQSAIAGIPNIKVCMRCHALFAKDRPEIKKLTAIFNSGLDLPWQRVYGFSPSAHVKFNHAPHIHAGVDCSTCHGDVTVMTVAVRAVNLNMGFCLRCHRAKQVSTDCITCHF